jgi:hypothetical protein
MADRWCLAIRHARWKDDVLDSVDDPLAEREVRVHHRVDRSPGGQDRNPVRECQQHHHGQPEVRQRIEDESNGAEHAVRELPAPDRLGHTERDPDGEAARQRQRHQEKRVGKGSA